MANVVRRFKRKANVTEPLPNELILEDLNKKKWKLKASIGTDGFGKIYSATDSTASSTSNYPFVVKIEPHGNGPLFVEMHFYMRVGKPAAIKNFKKSKRLTGLGMPKYIAHGSHKTNNVKYRFLVIDKFGTDLNKLLTENNRRFPAVTVFNVGIQILQVIEYIHSKGYIHGDIKGANVLLGVGPESTTQVYLANFGMSTKFNPTYEPTKEAHNGTIEYMSRDAHQGVPSRRGDLEMLGYNLTQWLGCSLPWQGNTQLEVQNKKEKHMADLPEFYKTCFGKEKPPAALVDYFNYVVSLKYEDKPDYEKLCKILLSGVTESGGTINSPLQFNGCKSAGKIKSKNDDKQENDVKPAKRTKKAEEEESDLSTQGFTPEMKRMKEKLDSRKKTRPQKFESSKQGFTAEMKRMKAKLDSRNKNRL